MKQYQIGIDLGSTGAKYVVMRDGQVLYRNIYPTGWNAKETAGRILEDLEKRGFHRDEAAIVSTGYGRAAVDGAHKAMTEITCHAKGAEQLFGTGDTVVIDIGGQDTKIIVMEGGRVKDFVMNDKCSAGTGRFLEVMAAAMGESPYSLSELARNGSGVKISSMCTVFAESEVISLVGGGQSKENIAYGIIESITEKVAAQCRNLTAETVYLTGGLCGCGYILESLGQKLKKQIYTHELARYAGAIGAAILSKKFFDFS